jgi:hypothetical protein
MHPHSRAGWQRNPECADDALRFIQAHQSVVDVDTLQLIADGMMEQDGCHRRVHFSGEGTDDPPLPTVSRISRVAF